MSPICIFCRQSSIDCASIEHIIPVSLGGDDSLVLDAGEVCSRCNSRLSKADEKLIEVLRPLVAFAGVRTRKGNWQSADLGNMRIASDRQRAHVELDRYGLGEVTSTRIFLPNNQIQVRARFARRFDGRLSRGLHKIAFELACKSWGPSVVLREQFDQLRDYIRGASGGFRHVLLFDDPTKDIGAIRRTHCVSTIMPFDLEPSGFLADLSFGGLHFQVAVTRDDRSILEYGREQNRKVGRIAWLSFDSEGKTRHP